MTPDQFGEYYAVYGLVQLKTQKYLMVVIERELAGKINNHKIYKANEISLVALGVTHSPAKEDEKQLMMLANFLSRDHLYFCDDGYDLTSPLSQNFDNNGDIQKRFLFNEVWINKLGKFRGWGTNVVSGYISTEEVELEGNKVRLTMLSRREKERSGMRFMSRGVDSKGNVSNFADNEQILEIFFKDGKRRIHSFNQIRGSIPVYWKQTPNLKWSPPVTIGNNTKERNEAFSSHMNKLVQNYKEVYIVNLIDKKGSQKRLGDIFTECYKTWKGSEENYTWFDFHHECRKMQWQNLSKLVDQIRDKKHDYGYFEANIDGENSEISKTQKGVFRVNCMDNLDRTNVVQSVIARNILLRQLHYVLQLIKTIK